MLQLPVLPTLAEEQSQEARFAHTTSGTFKNVEIEINTACDLACFACDRMSDVVTTPNMTVDQVALFVKESIELNWEWERIRLLGGEPTLHPQFKEIVELIVQYRDHFPDVFIQVLTNGLGKSAVYASWLNSLNIDLHAEAKSKDKQPPWFINTRITPLDRDPNVGELPPCSLFGIRGCGIGLTRHGYFMDGAGGAVARVAGYDVGAMSLRDVTWEKMYEQAKILCRICGHWNPVAGPLVTKLVKHTGQVTGRFWQEALERYKANKPKLSVYGSTPSPGDKQ